MNFHLGAVQSAPEHAPKTRVARLLRLRNSPLFWILTVATIARLIGIGWGLPASDAWDDDGIAPRDILVGVIETFTPGHYYIYPPLQFAILSILTFPVTVDALAHARSFSPSDVIATFIQVPYMTAFAIVARVVSVAMSVGTIFLVARLTQTIGGRRAGYYAAAACALEATLVYYGHVTNLDGPCLFWCAFSLWFWIRTIADHEPKHFRWAVLLAAAAVATKDQAYAIFALSIPAVLLLWFATDDWPRRNVAAIGRVLLPWTVIAFSLLLAIDGAFTNPSGFVQRLTFLTGPASRDYAFYDSGWPGRVALLRDMLNHFPHSYPFAALVFGSLGLLIHVQKFREDRATWVAGLLPFLGMISFVVTFNFVALRSEERFVLPLWVLASVYIGIAADRLLFDTRRFVRRGAGAVAVSLAAWGIYECAAVDAAFVYDPRYEAEEWLAAHVAAGQTLEIYGQNCYLPRLPMGATMTRVDIRPLNSRNPQLHVTEIWQPFENVEQRKPDYLLIPATWMAPYLTDDKTPPGPGQIYPAVQQRVFARTGARRYFRALAAGQTNYRLVHESVYRAGFWPLVQIHESLGETIRIYQRSTAAAG